MRTIQGLIQELRPLPVLATFGALFLSFVLAGNIPSDGLLFFAMTFFLLYAIHFLDTYEDAFVRKEDAHKTFHFAHGSTGTLTKNELLMGAILSSIIFLVLLFFVAQGKMILFPVLVLSGYVLGVLYSPVLSKNLITSLLVPPVGVVLGMASAFVLAGGMDWGSISPFMVSVFLLLLGGKAWMDIADQDADNFTKRDNVALLWGEPRAGLLARGAIMCGLLLSLVRTDSWGHHIGIVIIALLFFRGFSMSAKRGVHWIMPAIFLFLLWEIGVQILVIQ